MAAKCLAAQRRHVAAAIGGISTWHVQRSARSRSRHNALSAVAGINGASASWRWRVAWLRNVVWRLISAPHNGGMSACGSAAWRNITGRQRVMWRRICVAYPENGSGGSV